MHTHTDGRHEHGQNFLTDQRTIQRVVNLVAQTRGPILEIGPGRGALTLPMQKSRRPLTAVEIHPRLAEALQQHLRSGNRVINADFLNYRMPKTPHTMVGNLPFHLTTAILRKLLYDQHWSTAILLTQWEVARRRAGVGGSSMMTAQWVPYYTFALEGRVPGRAYSPVPSVDAGILTVSRRAEPLVPWSQRRAYAGFVHAVFTGPGRGMAQILRCVLGCSRDEVGRLCAAAGIRAAALPKQLSALQWAALWRNAPPAASVSRHAARRGAARPAAGARRQKGARQR